MCFTCICAVTLDVTGVLIKRAQQLQRWHAKALKFGICFFGLIILRINSYSLRYTQYAVLGDRLIGRKCRDVHIHSLLLFHLSAGGHYVPNLAWEIVQGNKRAEAAAAAEGVGVSPGKGYINLKGFFVGNAWTDAYIDNKGALDYWWTHSMIGDESYAAIRDNCDFNTIGPLMRGSEALTLPGTYKISRPQPPSVTNRRDQTLTKKQQQQQDTLDPADQGLGAKLGDQISDLRSQQSDLRSKPSDLRSITSGFEPLGHTRVQGWEGYGSSSTTRFWESEGGPMFSHKNDKEMVCAKWLDIAFKEHGNVNIYEIYAGGYEIYSLCADLLLMLTDFM
eukprot:GHUV01051829.1.p1 GENE.GHUV01051829.1~~GHUV01051829.1.p1  ORF type:complete len:335 (-),score=29.80 GHUV01051829.1:524-1528(-)